MKGPQLFPPYGNFDLRTDAHLRAGGAQRLVTRGGASGWLVHRGASMDKLNQVLLHKDILVGADLDAWLSNGGGEGLAKALDAPEEVIRIIEEAGLRGMGGAGFRPIASGPPPRRVRTR